MELGNLSEQASAAIALVALGGVIKEYLHQRRQKRLELAQDLSRDLETDDVLNFAVTCLDWAAGTIPVPEKWRAVIGKAEFSPNINLLRTALEPTLPALLVSPTSNDAKNGLLLRHSFVTLFNALERVEQLHRCGAVVLEDLSPFGWIAAQLTSWQYIDIDERPTFFMNALKYWYKSNNLNAFIYELAQKFPNT